MKVPNSKALRIVEKRREFLPLPLGGRGEGRGEGASQLRSEACHRSFTRKQIFRPVFLLLASHLLAAGVASGQGTLHILRTNGPNANRLNLVFLSEGYTNGQTGKFTNDARNVLQQILLTQPYREYTNYLNAFAIFVASAEAGSDHPASNQFRNTYFNSTYDSYGIARLLTIPPNDYDGNYANGYGKVYALLAALRPDYDIPLLLVNDTVYGGSGGDVPTASTHASSAEIAIHEIGHSFANLGDEYSAAFPGFPDIEEPNTTRQTNRAQIKWNAWILPTTPVPTPDTSTYNTVVGLFEGAHYHTNGWFRPRRDCKMRTLFVPFCQVCSETLVTSIYGRLDPIDSVSPPTNALVALTNALPVTLSVARQQPSTHALSVQWSVNGVPRADATNDTLTLAAWDLPAGTNTVRADITDATTLVRNDPQQLLRESRSWRVRSALVPPALAIRRTNDQVALTWSPWAAGFLLQSRTDLQPGTQWTTVTVISNQPGADFAATNGARYFRLMQP